MDWLDRKEKWSSGVRRLGEGPLPASGFLAPKMTERKLSTEELMLLNLVLEKTLESPLDCKEIQPVHSKGDQSWDFFGKNDAKAETPVLWPPHAKS